MLLFAAIIPNQAVAGVTLNHFAATGDEVERRWGFDFLSPLDGAIEESLEPARVSW